MITTDESASLALWDRLHADTTARLIYPNEHVVRFLKRRFPPETRRTARVLDIGFGAGRHVKVLCDLGFAPFGVEFSAEAVTACRAILDASDQHADLCQGSMFDLPYADEAFDAAISFGVFYYADAAGMARAIAEMHRVLRPGGRAFVVVRTDRDYRYGKGERLEPNTFRLTIDDTNEHGAVMHFLPEDAVEPTFAAFADVAFERAEMSVHARRDVHSDWLIEVRKG